MLYSYAVSLHIAAGSCWLCSTKSMFTNCAQAFSVSTSQHVSAYRCGQNMPPKHVSLLAWGTSCFRQCTAALPEGEGS